MKKCNLSNLNKIMVVHETRIPERVRDTFLFHESGGTSGRERLSAAEVGRWLHGQANPLWGDD